MPIDDRELRLTAADWLHQLRRTDPRVALACSYIKDTPNLALIVEVKITSAGSSRRPQRTFSLVWLNHCDHREAGKSAADGIRTVAAVLSCHRTSDHAFLLQL